MIAYVANGTHGSYPTESMFPDVWADGGIEYGPEDFNWIIAEEETDQIESTHDDHGFCLVPHITVGVPQNEPKQGYWPHHYPSTYHVKRWVNADPAPWHRPEWKKGMASVLTLEMTPSKATLGEKVIFSGQLTPQISTTIYLRYRKQGTSYWQGYLRVHTQIDGHFSRSFRILMRPGIYEFIVYWPGNQENPPAMSQIATLTVT